MRSILVLFVVFGFFDLCKPHLISVYWGQDSAGGISLTFEKELLEYCKNFHYDIITIAFVDIFFDRNNKDNVLGINLSNHCNTSYDGYPDLLECPQIAEHIKECQKNGKKIVVSLGGASGLYGFNSADEAQEFANTVWNLFLGGSSTVRPFKSAVLDGVDLDIEASSPLYYTTFVQAIRLLMSKDITKKYLITGAPQCPFPDYYLGPSKDTVLYDIGEEFDYLYVQFYNNYCCLGNENEFIAALKKWFNFSNETKTAHGKGPSIFVGLPSHPRASGGPEDYQTPEKVQAIYETIKSNKELGGFMLWDASFDSNNLIENQYYSALLYKFILN
ncbi:uncharacterized protein LOC100214393 isoform X1 [Hydra vulgaris]|uniref:uncharacterized protein LOC100214393 isoform X1 n=1 Tax=Hydra vulgaris TaxID=6087 RepID=UPI00019259AF|nr:chitinase 1 [Hydra vulgaris]